MNNDNRFYVNESETVCLVDWQIIGNQEIYAELAILDNCEKLFTVCLNKKTYICVAPPETIGQGLVRATKVTFQVLDSIPVESL
jgi:tyrosine-protein phosphatase YwqE